MEGTLRSAGWMEGTRLKLIGDDYTDRHELVYLFASKKQTNTNKLDGIDWWMGGQSFQRIYINHPTTALRAEIDVRMCVEETLLFTQQ